MKVKSFLFVLVTVLSISLNAQPPETIYDGTVIATGFRQGIILALDGPFPIGFGFTFYETAYTQFYVTANGLVMFTDPGTHYDTEVSIPNVAAPNNYIAPFWDNLSIMDGGNVMYKTVGTAPYRKCIIQFKNMGFDPVTIPLGTFSVILYETTNIIQSQYRLIVDPYSANSHGGSATIGIENSTGTSGVLFSYHNPDAVHREDAISYSPSGSTYTVNPDAVYDGVFLTTNTSLPDPGIVELISPSADAVIGDSHNFEWGAATNATSYRLVVDVFSDFSTATNYNAGSNLNYEVTGLTLDETYYWVVYSINSTAQTWGELRKFSTNSTPPLTAIPREIWVPQGLEREVKLQFSGGDASAKTAIITSLPGQGELWQSNMGIKSTRIITVPETVSNPEYNLIYVASGGAGNSVGNFNFKFTDTSGDSPEETITINVSPPGVPNLLYTAKSTTAIEIQFDIPMADPAGKQNKFTVTVDGTPVTISTAALKAGDPYTIVLNLAVPLTGTETVLVSYTQGDVSGATGGLLPSFSDQPVTLSSQIITFPAIPAKQYGNPAFNVSASSNSGLALTYTSSNLVVATVSVSTVTILSVGTSDITARQAGNATYAPARYIRTLTVNKAVQTINFSPLTDKTYGDTDFPITATAGSGLAVTLVSDNPSVATISGNSIHIAGAGTAIITASQAGNANYNAAPDVPQTLTVLKADQTISFSPLTDKTYGATDFPITATASSGLVVTLVSDNPSVATITGNSVHITGAGTAIITASQPGNTNYNPATVVPQIFTVHKADQTITFGSLTDKTYGATDFPITATASSGLVVTLVSDNTSVATITGNSVHIAGAGTAIITASQLGNTNYNAAPDVPQTLTVHKADQAITFSPLPDKTYGDTDFQITATAGSGLTVTLVSDNPAVATITGNSIHIEGAGTATITASQAGDQNYNPATPVQQLMTVTRAVLTFTAENKTRQYLAQNPELTYTISGFVNGETQAVLDNLPVIQTIATPDSPASIYPITISGGSDNNYNYLYVAGTLAVTKLQQTITFTAAPEKLLAGDTYTLIAASTSGLVILFESADPLLATITGDQLTGVSKGNVRIRAYQEGDDSYDPAEAFASVEIYSTHRDIMYLFTPNNDGINDLWELPLLSTWGKCDVKVYNRWGKLVYANPDYNNDWNGTSSGAPVPEGPYYFVIKTENEGVVKGTVNIVR